MWDPKKNPTRKLVEIPYFLPGIQHIDGILFWIIPHIMWDMFWDIFPLSARYPGKNPTFPAVVYVLKRTTLGNNIVL